MSTFPVSACSNKSVTAHEETTVPDEYPNSTRWVGLINCTLQGAVVTVAWSVTLFVGTVVASLGLIFDTDDERDYFFIASSLVVPTLTAGLAAPLVLVDRIAGNCLRRMSSGSRTLHHFTSFMSRVITPSISEFSKRYFALVVAAPFASVIAGTTAVFLSVVSYLSASIFVSDFRSDIEKSQNFYNILSNKSLYNNSIQMITLKAFLVISYFGAMYRVTKTTYKWLCTKLLAREIPVYNKAAVMEVINYRPPLFQRIVYLVGSGFVGYKFAFLPKLTSMFLSLGPPRIADDNFPNDPRSPLNAVVSAAISKLYRMEDINERVTELTVGVFTGILTYMTTKGAFVRKKAKED